MAEPTAPHRPGASTHLHHGSARGLWRGWMIAAMLLMPVLVAIWTVPGFMTQDGPTHVYNAWILADSFAPHSPYRPYYEVRWQPLPNWAGHLALAGLFRVGSAWVADRIVMCLSLAGFAASIVWLRWQVRGGQDLVGACLLSVFLSLNWLWLLGFTSFLLGSCLFPITLGVWWSDGDRLGPGHLAALLVLLVLGYFCHLVSLGLTVLGLVVLALLGPAPLGPGAVRRSRLSRLGRTAVSFIPLAVLIFAYLRLFRHGGPMHPVWENLADPYSPSAWAARLSWVEPLSLARKDALPFTDRAGKVFAVFSPTVWLCLAGLFWLGGWITAPSPGSKAGPGKGPEGPAAFWESPSASRRNQGVWLTLAVLLMVGGFLGPDSLGPNHGEFVPQRLVLLGLVALVPAFDLKLAHGWGRLAAAALVLAVALQSLIVWDYALYSNRTAGQISGVSDLVGRDQRIAMLLARIKSRFRANPLLHADSWLGVGTGNILWGNYETRYYYFPVQFRAGIDRPDSSDLEWLAITDDPRDAARRAAGWEQLLREHADSIDKVVVWESDPRLQAITRRWFDFVARRGAIRVYAARRHSL